MKSFLNYVAEDMVKKYDFDLSRTAVVFPNKRASLFLNDCLAHLVDHPLWSPAYITISDLFRQHSPLTVGDPIKLICDLHKSYVRCTGLSESLDRFYGWGQLLLADFDDIDKNMADARQVFANLANLHELDDISYLDDIQKDALRRFFGSIIDNHDSRLIRKFIDFWSHLYNIYEDYRQLLRQQGIGYEGMLYRDVAQDENICFQYDRYLFVGFNMMQKAEQELCLRLMRQGKAKFYWDFDQYYMHGNEAGHYISQLMQLFPNELDQHESAIYSNFANKKQVAYISAPTENIQARYVSHWLEKNNRISDGRRTAIILCNEGLLQTVVHCLPDEVGKVNITTGYPLQQSPVCSLLSHLITLQSTGFANSHDKLRLRFVSNVLRHPYAQYMSPEAPILLKQLTDAHRYFPTLSELHADDTLTMLFTPVGEPFNLRLIEWLLKLLRIVAHNSHASADPLMQESLFRTYTLLNRLHELIDSGDLDVDIITLQRLIGQLIQATSIPFHGEPAEGIQVMGVLETRNLDFDHLLILSCNEGNMPKGINDSSFIPYSIRKAFGLTTADNKVAIFAYYFHRLLQRANDITILYNNSTEGGHTGEMSRFMLQMLVESPHKILRKTLQAGQTPTQHTCSPIEKTDEVMRRIASISYISPSAINRYQRCQLQFFYNYVAGIKEPNADEEDEIDNRVFGNIFHEACELLYKQLFQRNPVVKPSDIDRLLHHPESIEMAVDKAIGKHLFKLDSNNTRLPQLNGLQIINREVIIRYIRQLLNIDLRLAPFTILGLEKPVSCQLSVGQHTVTVGGTIDRLDLINPDGQGQRIRVLDYKTGRPPHAVPASIDNVFDPSLLRTHHTDYYLQALFYSLIISNERALNPNRLPVSPALLFIQQTQADGYDPTLCFGKQPIADAEQYRQEFEENIRQILADIFNPAKPFSPTDDQNICSSCPYRVVCGQ